MNITLIGMAGSGKSAIGKELALQLDFSFYDLDQMIEARLEKKLQQVLDDYGDDAFIALEASEVQNLKKIDKSVLAPGGSIVYSGDAMRFLKNISKIIFLDTPFEEISQRIDPSGRGIVGLKQKTLRQLYDERRPLYQKYADIRINTVGLTPDKIVSIIKANL